MAKTLKKARKKAAALAIKPTAGVQKLSVNKLSDRVTSALGSRSWEDALSLLSSLQTGGLRPKLGALQRWVRMADLCGDPKQAARLIAGILRAMSTRFPVSVGDSLDSVGAPQQELAPAPVRRHEPWSAPALDVSESVERGTPAPAPAAYHGVFTTVQPEEPAQQQKQRATNRMEPNIYMTPPNTVEFPPLPPAQRADVPHVPGAFVMLGVLSPGVCQQLIAISQAMGYSHDVDYTFATDGGGAPNGSAARGAAAATIAAEQERSATGCVWLADETLLTPIFERCRQLLPQTIAGGALAGINARFRLYCYRPGAVYRPHIDGAWPGSGLSRLGQYVFDAYGGTRWSRLTFLVYLNDDFEGGTTTFYAPAADDPSSLEAYSVKPRQGNVLCFPHGDVAGSLVHEGSTVTKGAKYVIRTDVLYEVPVRQRGGGGGGGGGTAGVASTPRTK